MFGKIKINDGGVMKEISVELCPNDDDKISDSSKEALQFFVDNYEKYREIYLPTMLKYYQNLRSCLGYDEEYEVDGDALMAFAQYTLTDKLIEYLENFGINK